MFDTKYCFLPLSFCRGPKKSVAKASSLILAVISGFCAIRLVTVVARFRKLAGMNDASPCWGSPACVSRSRAERPRCAVLSFAVARTAGGVRYGRGNDCIMLYIGRVVVV